MNFSPAFFQLKPFKSENLRVSSFGRSVAFLGLVARQLMRREKTGDKCWGFVHFAKRNEMEALAISSAVRGFHVNKDIWKPSIGDKLPCEREFDSCFEKFAIKVVNNGETVGHLPRKFSKIAWHRLDLILVF